MNKWIKQGNNFKVVPSSISVQENLPKAIYSINYDLRTNEFSLNKIADKFTFDFELLDIEQKFIDHVIKSYNNTSGNFGILLNGTKGTGKSITAKIIANSLDLPVILVDTAYEGIDGFLASLNFKCILFFDEFEKNFNRDDDVNILTIMDGVYNCTDRKIFILTTNHLYVNTCLLSRPSRIRYVKEFKNISKDALNYLLDKYLEDQSIRNELSNYVISLEICTIDIVKSIIKEVNIHGSDSLDYIKEIFNVSIKTIRYPIVSSYSSYCSKTFSREQCILNVKKYWILSNTPRNAIEIGKERSRLSLDTGTELEYEDINCLVDELKVGMLLRYNPIVEIIRDERIFITQQRDGSLIYNYIPEITVYNEYKNYMKC